MADSQFFKEAFNQVAVEGCIGSPMGKLAYCYLRVSSSDQADEGRSGLPRQILNCHEAALRAGYKIPWDFIFADDHSGFAFRDRPMLSKLRDDQAEIVRIIFDKIGNDGLSLRGMAAWLDERFPPPGNGAYWSPRQVENIIRNPLYKGEFAAHRWDYKQIKAAHQNPFEPEKM